MQNSLPSGSARTAQPGPSAWRRSASSAAPRCSARSIWASRMEWVGHRSKWIRFLAVLPSGTRLNRRPGWPGHSVTRIESWAAVSPGRICRPRSSDQKEASVYGSNASKVISCISSGTESESSMGTHSRASSAAGPRAYPVSLIQLSANSVGAAKETSPYDSPPVTQKSGRRVSPTAGLVRTWAGTARSGWGTRLSIPRRADQLSSSLTRSATRASSFSGTSGKSLLTKATAPEGSGSSRTHPAGSTRSGRTIWSQADQEVETCESSR